MKRYLGKAIFEGVEVADSDYQELRALREEENSEIEMATWEFDSDVQALKQDTSDEISYLQSIRDNELAQLKADYKADLAQAYDDYGPYDPYDSALENALDAIADQYLYDCKAPNQDYNAEAASVYHEYDAEYASLKNDLDQTIDYIHDYFSSLIDEILDARYTIPIHMLNNKPGACDACRELNKAASTLSVLTEKGYIPPFHKHCRCYITVDGYAVMSGITPFEITGLL